MKFNTHSVCKLSLAMILSIQSVACQSVANEARDGGEFLVEVFDCYVPVPTDFIVHTRDPERIVLSLRSMTEIARIVVSAYEAELGSAFALKNATDNEGIHVEEYMVSSAFREDAPAVRLHDGKQQMLIYGPPEGLVESMLSGCRNVKRGALYE